MANRSYLENRGRSMDRFTGRNQNSFFSTENIANITRPKWIAGERIYIPREREFATIKWIGSRHYKFIVVIEYDNPIEDPSFESDDLPFLIKRGFGKKLAMSELNQCARKIANKPALCLLSKIHRWGLNSLTQNKIPTRTSIFYVNYP